MARAIAPPRAMVLLLLWRTTALGLLVAAQVPLAALECRHAAARHKAKVRTKTRTTPGLPNPPAARLLRCDRAPQQLFACLTTGASSPRPLRPQRATRSHVREEQFCSHLALRVAFAAVRAACAALRAACAGHPFPDVGRGRLEAHTRARVETCPSLWRFAGASQAPKAGEPAPRGGGRPHAPRRARAAATRTFSCVFFDETESVGRSSWVERALPRWAAGGKQ